MIRDMQKKAELGDLERILEGFKLKLMALSGSVWDWIPLRAAWCGADPTLGNRVQERTITVVAQGLYGRPNTGELIVQLQEHYWVTKVSEESDGNYAYLTAYSSELPFKRFPRGTGPSTPYLDFLGLSPGIIKTVVQLELVEFRLTNENKV